MRPPMAVWATWMPLSRNSSWSMRAYATSPANEMPTPARTGYGLMAAPPVVKRMVPEPRSSIAYDGCRGGDRAQDAELQWTADVVDARLKDRLHELLRGERRILEHVDWSQLVGQFADGRLKGGGGADVSGSERHGQALGAEIAGQLGELLRASGDEADRQTLAAEAPGDGITEVGPGADDDDRHGVVPPRGAVPVWPPASGVGGPPVGG